MGMSTDVKMPRNIVPEFPDRCVVCLSQTEGKARIVQHSSNPFATFFMPILMLFGWSRVRFPLCPGCRLRFYFQRWIRTIICWGLVIGTGIFAMPYFQTLDPFSRKIALLVVCLIVALPYITYEVFVSRYFETTAYPKTTTYEFKSQQLGFEFYVLNKEKNPHTKIELTIGD